MRLNLLIEAAAQIVGSEYKLAQHLDIHPSAVYAWKNGRRTCAVEDRIEMAHLAGLPVEEAIADALMERWEGKPRAERLREVFVSRGWRKR